MSLKPSISNTDLAEALAGDVGFLLQEVVQAVNDAPEEDFVGGSEMRVFRAGELFRQKLFERAMQLRVQAAEAAFSPSGRPAATPAEARQQGGPGLQRLDRQR